jgi:hypothetical protein
MAARVFGSTDLAGHGHRHAIARLSAELHVPLHEVRQIYEAQLDRLGVEARIESFLGVLATSHTRSILRGCGGQSAAKHRISANR